MNALVNGIRIVQGNSSGTRFSVVDLERHGADSVAVRVVAQPTTYVDEVTPDTAVAALVGRYQAEVGPRVDEVIAHLDRPLPREGPEWAIGNVMADAQRAATGTQVAMMNNGGIRTELLAGPVRYRDLFRLQPFANTLVTMRLTGEQLVRALEQGMQADGTPDTHVSGMRVTYDASAPTGSRIREVHLSDGTRVEPAGVYTVTVNDFMAEGGSGYTALREGADVVRTGIVDLDALIQHLRAQPAPLPVPETDRFVPAR